MNLDFVRLGWLLVAYLYAVLGRLTTAELEEFKNNFGAEDKFILIEKSECSDLVFETLTEHSHEYFGEMQGHEHFQVSPEALAALDNEAIRYKDHTTDILRILSANSEKEEPKKGGGCPLGF